MKTLYAVPWYTCNLNCSHCHVSHRTVKEDFDKFLETLTGNDYDHVVLFGGEPTLHKDKFLEIIRTGEIDSVSTNLVCDTTFIQNLFLPEILERNISIATSWNPTRFSRFQETVWSQNVANLCSFDIDLTVMITLTEDLIEMSPDLVAFQLHLINQLGVGKFMFEPYIGDFEVHDKADEWLCELHDICCVPIRNLLEEKLKNWNCDCDDVCTLEPDGIIRKGCPDLLASGIHNYCVDCITCSHSDICRPCALQKTCSYPKKLAKKLGVIK